MQTEQLQALVAQREELDLRIKRAQFSAKAEVLKTAAQAFALHGISREELDLRIKRAQFSAKAEVLKTAAQAFALHGISREEVVAHFSKTNSAAGTKVPPKYRHKATGQTWTGRGKKPTWYAEARDPSEIEYLGPQG